MHYECIMQNYKEIIIGMHISHGKVGLSIVFFDLCKRDTRI